MKATIFDIQRSSFVDGPGIRTTVFFKGCNLRCLWCHNPESWHFKPQLMFYQDRCKGCGRCREKCPHSFEHCTLCGACTLCCAAEARQMCGREYSAEEVFDVIAADRLFYETSGGGVTFSGGECMLQLDFLAQLLKRCKENGIHTAVDTAGEVPFESFQRILPYTDLFLYDVKLMDPEKHKHYVGTDNSRILENLALLLQQGKPVWIRVPVIAGVNDSEDEMLSLYSFFEKHGFPQKIELLPYHKMGQSKSRALGMEPHCFEAPSEEKMAKLRAVIARQQS